MTNAKIARRDAQRARRAEARGIDTGVEAELTGDEQWVVVDSPDADRIGTVLESTTDAREGEELQDLESWQALNEDDAEDEDTDSDDDDESEEDVPDGLTEDEVKAYEDHTVEELKGFLAARDLPVSGIKAELIARLEEDDEKFQKD